MSTMQDLRITLELLPTRIKETTLSKQNLRERILGLISKNNGFPRENLQEMIDELNYLSDKIVELQRYLNEVVSDMTELYENGEIDYRAFAMEHLCLPATVNEMEIDIIERVLYKRLGTRVVIKPVVRPTVYPEGYLVYSVYTDNHEYSQVIPGSKCIAALFYPEYLKEEVLWT